MWGVCFRNHNRYYFICPMQITLNLDESLLNEALQLTNLLTQVELVNLALQELV